MTPADLPPVNAALNGLSAVFLSWGLYFIRRRRQAAHRNCMLAAFVTSALTSPHPRKLVVRAPGVVPASP